MERLAVTFAGYYLRARSGEGPVPRCWRAADDVAADPDLVVVQHLLLGINAHVNHDLAQAVVDVAPGACGLAVVRRDFDAINDVLAATFDTVIDDIDRVAAGRAGPRCSAAGGPSTSRCGPPAPRPGGGGRAARPAGRRRPPRLRGRARPPGLRRRLPHHPAGLPGAPGGVAGPAGLEERDPRAVSSALLGPLASPAEPAPQDAL